MQVKCVVQDIVDGPRRHLHRAHVSGISVKTLYNRPYGNKSKYEIRKYKGNKDKRTPNASCTRLHEFNEGSCSRPLDRDRVSGPPVAPLVVPVSLSQSSMDPVHKTRRQFNCPYDANRNRK